MKKSIFKAVIIAFCLSSSACTLSGNKGLEGAYKGTDGSSQLPNQVDWTIATTGDGLLAGIWTSNGEITQGQLSGKLGYFGNEMILYVKTGNCTGQFHGNFTFVQDELKGVLKDNANCPERSYRFDVKKVL